MPQNPNISSLSEQQIIQRVMDETNDRLRVDAVVTASIADVIIHASESSIAIGDQNSGNLMTVNPDGSINVDTILDAATDNVAISDGTDTLAINPDGSINVTTTGGTSDVNINGLNAFQTSQYSISTSAIQLAPIAMINRSSMSIKAKNTTNSMVYLGNSSGVTTSTGYPLFNGDSLQLDLTPSGSIWAISDAPGQMIYVLEIG